MVPDDYGDVLNTVLYSIFGLLSVLYYKKVIKSAL